MDVNGYLYSGQKRIGITTNPIYVQYSTVVPSEWKFQSEKEEFKPVPPEIKYIDRIVEKIVEKTIVKGVPIYNIKGEGLIFKIWYWIGHKWGWIKDGR